MASKTRDRLIEVSRQLFVRKGIDNTTMSDIANACDKGRRTIYTYFKNKREIYNAVLESESESLVAELRNIVDDQSLTCAQRLELFLQVRLLDIEIDQSLYGQLKSFFSRDYRRLERIRQLAYTKENQLMCKLVDLGVAAGEFQPQQAARLRQFADTLSRIADLSLMNIEGTEREVLVKQRRAIIQFILESLVVKQ